MFKGKPELVDPLDMEPDIQPGSAGDSSWERTILLRLPVAAPDTYLSWMAYWREVEAKMLELPALEQWGSEEAAPFLHGSIALTLSDLVRELIQQSMKALEIGAGSVAPEVEVPASVEKLAAMASYMSRRGAWLGEFARSIGIESPSTEEKDLRHRVIDLLRHESKKLAGADRSLS
jgi:hypothetical protein